MAGISEIRNSNCGVEEYLNFRPSAAEEITGFIPTRYELVQIVKFWYREILEEQWTSFYIDSGDIKFSKEEFAKARIEGITALLGKVEIRTAVAEVQKEFSRDCDSEDCHVFLHSDEVQEIWRLFE
jgi:hypothetical protein